MFDIGNVGGTLSIVASFLYESFGGQLDTLIGGILAPSGYFLLATATSEKYRGYFAENIGFVCLGYFLAGYGSSFIYIATMMPNIENAANHHRGKIVGLLDACNSLGPAVFAAIYNTWFTNGYVASGEEILQNLSGFFVLLAFVTISSCICMLLFVGRIHERGGRIAEDQLRLMPTVEEEISQFSEVPSKQYKLNETVRRSSYVFLLLMFVLASCSQLTFQSNIPTFLKSFNLTEHNLLFNTLNMVLQAATKLAAGLISDLVASYGTMPRSIVFLLPYLFQALSLCICIFVGDNFAVLLITCICVGMGYGVTWCQIPVITGELFGGSHLPSNLSSIMLMSGFTSKIIKILSRLI